MKENEAPEKLYILFGLPYTVDYAKLNKRRYEEEVEYIRTDAFIEKTYSWLKNHYRDYMYNPTGERLEAFFGGDMCNDFKDYIKGELL